MREVWKNIPGYDRCYQASNKGRIRRGLGGPGAISGKILKLSINGRGYFCLMLRKKFHYVHRLVLRTFCGECPPGQECRHLDGNKNNNTRVNLAWGTKSENQQDCIKHGTKLDNRGSKNWNSKLTENDIPKIRQLINDKIPHQEIADQFGISRIAITNIATKHTWKHVD